MATTCSEKIAICDEVIIAECQSTEINRSRKISGENTATTVSSAMTPISHTELQDLPIEVLDYILMKAVVKKVMDRKLAKSVWLDYALRVIQPMRTVWSRWNYCLATSWFRIMLSRILSNKVPAEISVASITAKSCNLNYIVFAKLGSQIYFASMDLENVRGFNLYHSYLRVFEVEDLFRCTKAIRLPIIEEPQGVAACKQSNSIYVWGYDPNVVHLVPDGNEGFDVLCWPPYSPPNDVLGSDPAGNCYRIDSFSVLDDGNVLVQRCVVPKDDPDRACDVNDDETRIVSVHRPDGFVVWNVKLPDVCQFLSNVVMKSNGNFVYANPRDAIVTEIDQDGKKVRNFHWKVGRERLFLDSYDRVILLDSTFNLVFLDAELNFLCEVPLEVDESDKEFLLADACFYKEINELILVSLYGDIMFVKLAL